jgi:hypothetical protein
MDIENDPYVRSLRSQLNALQYGSHEWFRIDQKLSKTLRKQNSHVHKSIRDFENAAISICGDLGSWAADWYVAKVVAHARARARPSASIFRTLKDEENHYLSETIRKIEVTAVSYEPTALHDGVSAKMQVLINSLLDEKRCTENQNESYSGLVFANRRDAGTQRLTADVILLILSRQSSLWQKCYLFIHLPRTCFESAPFLGLRTTPIALILLTSPVDSQKARKLKL